MLSREIFYTLTNRFPIISSIKNLKKILVISVRFVAIFYFWLFKWTTTKMIKKMLLFFLKQNQCAFCLRCDLRGGDATMVMGDKKLASF